MGKIQRTNEGELLTALTLDLFRVNTIMMATGDRLVSKIGLTSSRWQILGTIVASNKAMTMAQIARNMGTSRQNIQRIMHDMIKMQLIKTIDNPRNKRASLIVLTDKGKEKFDDAMSLQIPWVNKLSIGLRLSDIQITFNVLRTLLKNLEEKISD